MGAVAQPIPDDADPKWKELNQTLKDLTLKLLNHDAMRRNKTQPFMTPAADKNRVYFLWDSVSRTLVRLPFASSFSSLFLFSYIVPCCMFLSPRHLGYPARPEIEHQADPCPNGIGTAVEPLHPAPAAGGQQRLVPRLREDVDDGVPRQVPVPGLADTGPVRRCRRPHDHDDEHDDGRVW